MQNIDTVVSKVRKLLALAGSANEHEAALAAERAHEMLAWHNLSLDEVKEENADPFGDITKEEECASSRSRPWTRQIWAGCAALYFCKYYYYTVDRVKIKRDGSESVIRVDLHALIGAPHNIEITKLTAQYLVDTVERLAKEGAKGQPRRNSFIDSFRNSAALRLRQRLNEKRVEAMQHTTQTASGSTLPALASLYDQYASAIANFMANDGIRLRAPRGRMGSRNVAGHTAGTAAGDSISLSTQVAGGGSGRLLGK